MEFKALVGKTLTEVTNNGDEELLFVTKNEKFRLFHDQDCCECVKIEDIAGDLTDLIGSPIIQAEETTNTDNPPEDLGSYLWTFYRIATAKGLVVIRWLGESNGYYSESVDFEKIDPI